MNILLVEDDYLLGRSTVRLLEASGQHRVRLTHNAADVFKLCEAGSIELVLMDVNLPGTFWQDKEVTGVDLSRILKSNPMTWHLPVVLLTANATEVDQVNLMSSGLADLVCTKPIKDADRLLSVLVQVTSAPSMPSLGLSAS
ncbi:MAG: response regulator [Phormidesmis sp.]